MLRVIISDDEINICNLIISMVDWQDMGLELVAVTNNGIAAYQKIRELRPDILITDIKMPQMDGLEVIKHVIDDGIPLKSIIISGFNDFHYAHTAIKYGVEDFLIKPIEYDELKSSLEKTILKIMSSRSNITNEKKQTLRISEACSKVRRSFVSGIFRGLMPFNEYIIEKINSEYYFSYSEGAFQLVQIFTDKDDNTNDYLKKTIDDFTNHLSVLCFDMETITLNNKISILLNYDKVNFKAIDALFNFLPLSYSNYGTSFTLCVGNTYNSIGELRYAAEEIRKVSISSIFLGSGHLIHARDVPGLDTELKPVEPELKPILQNSVEIMDFDAFDNLVSNYIQEKSEYIRNACPGLICTFLENVYISVTELLNAFNSNELSIPELKPLSDNINSFHSFDEMKHYVMETIRAITSGIQMKKGSLSKKLIIVTDYVKSHYAEHIELEDVAGLVYLSPGYLGKLFKQEAGVCFSDYVLQVRMDAAKEMLRDMKYNISEISDSLGYKEPRYFSKFFKKYTGVKPSDYRKLYQIQ